jgi:hypothetical protein
MGVFQQGWCDLIKTIWAQVPMEWHAGQAVRQLAPVDHPCSTPAVRPAAD